MEHQTVVLDRDGTRRTLVRIAHEIVEKNATYAGEAPLAIVGVHRRGAVLAARLAVIVAELAGAEVPLGSVDISFYRDDLGRRVVAPPAAPVVRATELDFPIDGRTIVIVDDVLYTGRTIRAALEALADLGRPRSVQLAVLVDRGGRELPIRADYVGKNVAANPNQRVYVRLAEIDGIDAVIVGQGSK